LDKEAENQQSQDTLWCDSKSQKYYFGFDFVTYNEIEVTNGGVL